MGRWRGPATGRALSPTALALAAAAFAAVFLVSCLPPFPERSLPDDPASDWDGDGYTERDGDCDDEDDTRSPDTLWYPDVDLDAYGDNEGAVASCEAPKGATRRSGDCDDTRADVNPAATEACNQRDDDCDGLVDDADTAVENTRAYYIDADGDGHGDEATESRSCVQPHGTVLTLDDCDDTRTDVNPDAVELCDEIDNDCDGRVDDADDNVSGRPTWYRDGDADGYGDAMLEVVVACTAPEGFSALPGDCADADPAVNPAAEERCDTVDNDCDGQTDGSDADVVDAALYYEDLDGDGFGDPAKARVACEPRDGWVLEGSDCDDTDGYVFPGQIEVCNGVDDDCDVEVDEGCT